MRESSSIHSLCRICLNQGSRNIYNENFMTRNIVSTNDIELDRIAEKLRYVTLLKVNPKENLPQQICDLCIVQLNVSYNFKRLALKNDFYIRQYMIENGMNLMKEDHDDDVDNGIETALEIHQIHNVYRTSNRRPLIAPPPPPQAINNTTTTATTTTTSISELRRNSTNSSVSGVSAMIVNGCDSNNITPSSSSNRNVNESAIAKKPFNVRPIQIKTEVIDPDYEDVTAGTNGKQTTQSSPSNSSGSVFTINSSSASKRAKTPPMIVINGFIPYNNEKSPSAKKKPSTTLSSRSDRPPPRKVTQKMQETADKRPRNATRDLRTIKKSTKPEIQNGIQKKKLKEAALKAMEKLKKEKMKKKKIQMKQQQKNKAVKNNKIKLGRPPLTTKKGKQVQQKTKNKKIGSGAKGGGGKRKS